MAKDTLLGSIELTKLAKVFMKDFKSKSGEKVKCICIPLEENHINEFPVKDANGNILLDQHSNRFGLEIRAVVDDEKDQYGRNGFIAKKLPKEVYEANKNNEQFLKDSQPFLGNFIKLSAPNHDAPGEEIPVVNEDSDDLPW